MNVIEDDYVIQQLSPTASDPAFRDTILPRARRAFASGFHTAGCQQIGYLLAELAITIENRVAVRTRFRKCLPQLLHYPRVGRMFRDIEMEDFASTMFDDEETMPIRFDDNFNLRSSAVSQTSRSACDLMLRLTLRAQLRSMPVSDLSSNRISMEETVQDSEGERGQGKEIHGHDHIAVIAKESRPELAGVVIRRQAPEIARYGAFRDVEAQFEKLAMNSRSAPGGIFIHHPPDKSSNFGIDFSPAKIPRPRSKAPEQTETSPMPGDNGLRFDDDQNIAPSEPKPTEQNPKYSILDAQARTRMFSLEYA